MSIFKDVNDDKTVAFYKGIPYAKPPVGDLRWKAPVEPDAWTDTLYCTDFGASEMQKANIPFLPYTREFIIEDGMTEDCLTLNVWTSNNEKINKPVIVFIHGGAYNSGGSSCEVYDGEAIAKKDVVFVSINYRLGIFGYLATDELIEEDAEAAGNYGTLDQIMALKWVQSNISYFGGDKDNVTIAGQSAGAKSVQTLIASPKAANLFKRAMIFSGNIDTEGELETQEERAAVGNKMFKKKSLSEMRDMFAKKIKNLYNWRYSSNGPCIDGSVVTDTFLNVLEAGTANDVDIIAGVVTGDSRIWDYGKDIDTSEHMIGTQNLIGSAMEKYNGSAYLYLFAHETPGSSIFVRNKCFHTSDLAYWFENYSDKRENDWTDAEYGLGNIMSQYLVNFVATGNPNGEGLLNWDNNVGNYNYMYLDNDCTMKTVSAKSIDYIEKRYVD